MRKALIEWLVERLQSVKTSVFLPLILILVIEPFSEAFSERFVNVGVAEQNMAGIASGLALNGHDPILIL